MRASASAAAAYLEEAFEDGDPALVSAALGDVARAKGMARIARESGLGRETLYKALSPGGNPEFATVLKVLRALGLRLHAVPAQGAAERQDDNALPSSRARRRLARSDGTAGVSRPSYLSSPPLHPRRRRPATYEETVQSKSRPMRHHPSRPRNHNARMHTGGALWTTQSMKTGT